MRITKYDLLTEYFYKERNRLEIDIADLQASVRYRRLSSVDCLELIIAQERLSAFLEFSGNVRVILKLNGSEGVYDENSDEKG